MMTNRARIASSRLVETRQRLMLSSHFSTVTSVWNSAIVAEAKLVDDQLDVIVDLLAVGELLGRQPAGLLEQRQIAIGVVVTLDAGVAVPVPDATEVAGVSMMRKSVMPSLGQVIAGQNARPASAKDRDLEILGDGLSRWRRA